MMLEELERRNYSQNTVRTHLMTIEDFARYACSEQDFRGQVRRRRMALSAATHRLGSLVALKRK
jgi:hypothetical protein